MTILARGKIKPPYKNKTEEAYAQRLDLLYKAGEILWWAYEGIRFRLAEGAWYTVDFVMMTKSGFIECHEVKGFWREAAKVRIKVASEHFPFRFIAVKAKAGGWEHEDF